VQAINDAARRANVARKMGDEYIWSKPRAKTHLQVKIPNIGLLSGNLSK
jgi:hypothetical protein